MEKGRTQAEKPKENGSGLNAPDLSGIPATQLQAELLRRQRRAQGLMRRYQRLLVQADALREGIDVLGGSVSAGSDGAITPARRPRSTSSLEDTLATVLAGRVLTVDEATSAVLAAGYQSSSQSFRRIVNLTLARSGRFERIERGRYTLRPGAQSAVER